MSFRTGPVSYARFRVLNGSGVAPADGGPAAYEELLERLAKNVLRPAPGSAPPETQAGWCAGRHVLDDEFTHEHCLYERALLAGMRVEVNRVPSELKRAYRAMAEATHAAGTETGFLSRAEKRAAKEESEQRCGEELADGRHRTSKLVPLLWDLDREFVLTPIAGDRATTLLRDLFQKSLEVRVQPRSSGSLAWDLLADRGLANELDDLKPSIFTPPPADRTAREEGSRRAVGATPDVPWAAASPEPKDFLGNEFLMWLWWTSEAHEGLVEIAEPASRSGPRDANGARTDSRSPRGDEPSTLSRPRSTPRKTAAVARTATVAVALDRAIELDCAWGVTGRASLRGDLPTRLPEAGKALQHGKWPRRVGLVVAVQGRSWSLSLQGDRFVVSGATLPEIDEAGSVREVIEQRLARTLELDALLVGLFDSFLHARASGEWSTRREQIAEWILRRMAVRAVA